MNHDIPRFNYTEHPSLNGEIEEFPVLYNAEDELAPESKALFEAARLVEANLNQIDGGLEQLIDEVGEILIDPERDKGLIIEDELGGGSVTIDSEDTLIVANYVEDGEWTVSTDLFFEMLGALKKTPE